VKREIEEWADVCVCVVCARVLFPQIYDNIYALRKSENPADNTTSIWDSP